MAEAYIMALVKFTDKDSFCKIMRLKLRMFFQNMMVTF